MPAIGSGPRQPCRAGPGRDRARAPGSRRGPAASAAARRRAGRPPPAASRAPSSTPTIRRIRIVSPPAPRAERSADPEVRARSGGPEWRNRSPSSSVITSSAGRPSRARISPFTALVTRWLDTQRRAGGGDAGEHRLARREAEAGRTSADNAVGDLDRRAAGGDQPADEVSARPRPRARPAGEPGPPRPARHARAATRSPKPPLGSAGSTRKPPAGQRHDQNREARRAPAAAAQHGRSRSCPAKLARRSGRAVPGRARRPPAPAPRCR